MRVAHRPPSPVQPIVYDPSLLLRFWQALLGMSTVALHVRVAQLTLSAHDVYVTYAASMAVAATSRRRQLGRIVDDESLRARATNHMLRGMRGSANPLRPSASHRHSSAKVSNEALK
jgi:hypothetical protein